MNDKLNKKLNSIPPFIVQGNNNNGKGFKKTASDPATASMGNPFLGTSVMRTPLMYVDPMFDFLLFLFPKDRLDEINKRLRHYYETDEIVGNALDLHTTLPLTDFYLECRNKENEKFWNEWKERVDLLNVLRSMVLDYYLLGEAIVLPVWDEYNSEISHFIQYPPEYIDIVQNYSSPRKYFLLKPDPKMVEKLKSNDENEQKILSTLDPEYLKSLEENKPFLLGDDTKIIYLARLSTMYRVRGVSILTRALKALLYKDYLRLLQYSFVNRHLFPLKIFKLGSESKGWVPNKSHFEKLRQMLAQLANDPDGALIWHFGLQVEYISTKDKIQPLIPEFDWVNKQIMAALFVNEEIIHGGLPATVRDTVNMRTLMYRYMDLREKIERMLLQQVFLPIAIKRGMYKGDKKTGNALDDYDIPRPIWKKINLANNTAEQQLLINLEEKGKIPLSMVLDMLGLDSELVKVKLKEQESTVLDPVYRQIREELAKSEGIREQVLSGKKAFEWVDNKNIKESSKIGEGSGSGGGVFGLGDLGLGGGSERGLGGVSEGLEKQELKEIEKPAAELPETSELPPLEEKITGENLPEIPTEGEI